MFPTSCLYYPLNYDCKWTIRRNYSYYLEFTKFFIQDDLQCNEDYLRIGDGVRLCGGRLPTRIFVDEIDGATDVVFHSNEKTTYPGFALRIVMEKGMM